MNANSSLHQRIANALGWPLADVQSMSLRSLRELVRPIDPQLGEDISFYSGAVLTIAIRDAATAATGTAQSIIRCRCADGCHCKDGARA